MSDSGIGLDLPGTLLFVGQVVEVEPLDKTTAADRVRCRVMYRMGDRYGLAYVKA